MFQDTVGDWRYSVRRRQAYENFRWQNNLHRKCTLITILCLSADIRWHYYQNSSITQSTVKTIPQKLTTWKGYGQYCDN